MKKRIKQCADCKSGEHDNYDEDIRLVTIIDPDTKKLNGRKYLCREHRNAYTDDGYLLK